MNLADITVYDSLAIPQAAQGAAYRRHYRVWHKQNVKYHAKCIQTTVKLPASVQVRGAVCNRCLSLQRNVNGNMYSSKYVSDIIF